MATKYKEWLDKIEEDGKNHPDYDSQHRFYIDVVANLLWIQEGLCAYTEQFLFDHTELSEDKWNKGRFGKGKFEFYGHVEHYDESLKKAKGWLWSNLFIVQADVNNKKGTKSVKYALKPDADDYDPFFLLEYDFKEHRFLPNSNRDFDLQENILHDINVLGLNFQSLVQDRKALLNTLVEEVNLNKKTVEESRQSLREYYTAFEMIIKTIGVV